QIRVGLDHSVCAHDNLIEEFDGTAHVGGGARLITLNITDEGAVVIGRGSARIESQRLVEIGDRGVQLAPQIMDGAAIVIALNQAWLKFEHLVEVGDCTLGISHEAMQSSPIEISLIGAWIELNSPVQVCKRSFEVPHLFPGRGAAVVSGGPTRVQLDRTVIVSNGLFQLPLLASLLAALIIVLCRVECLSLQRRS